MPKTLLVIANNNIGTSQSGGDTIFLELIKHWQNKLDITVFGCQEAHALLNRYQLDHIKFIKTDDTNLHSHPSVSNLLIHTIRRIFWGITTALKYRHVFISSNYCYTSSDFYPDYLLGLIYKMINRRGIWIACHYLFISKPTDNDSSYKSEKLKGWLYFLSQIPTKYFTQKFADIIYITSEPDISYFPNKKVIVIRGGVNLNPSKKYFQSKKITKKIYDGLFIGRLHPQKGVLELIDIWQLLCVKIPNAKLAIIGDGILNQQLISKIKKLSLQSNIKLFGFKIGAEKYKIIEQSKVILHPATFDSGGMAAADAMSFGLPGVSFDLPALKTYYPQGMIKVPLYDKHIFANNIYLLLTNKIIYNKTSAKAIDLIKNHWNWDKQSKIIYEKTFI
ncbi:MAG: glycosyltransferase [Candidatus Shapirobacteria bacterium]